MDKILSMIHSRSIAMLASVAMVVFGLKMCADGLTQKGTIHIKSAILSGEIETGSLGLFVLFLGVIVMCTVVLVTLKCTGLQQRCFEITTKSGKQVSFTNIPSDEIAQIIKTLE